MKKFTALTALLCCFAIASAQNHFYFTPTLDWETAEANFNVCLKVGEESATILQLTVTEKDPRVYSVELPATDYTQIRFLRLPADQELAEGDDWGWNRTGYMPFNYSEGDYWRMNTSVWDPGENDKQSFTVSTYDSNVPVEEPNQELPEDVVIKVKPVDDNTWSTVFIYAWGPETFGSWPGLEGTPGEDGWFSFTSSTVIGNVIFNNGNGGAGNQFDADNVTGITSSACYTITLSEATEVDCGSSEDVVIKVKPVDDNTWSTVFIYAWGPETFGSWPGLEGTPEEDGWFSFTSSTAIGNVIFNNGNGGEGNQFDADNVTGITSSACYTITLAEATEVECGPVSMEKQVKYNTSAVVSPNPAVSTLTIASDNVQTVSVFAASGKKVITAAKKNVINVANLPSGMYFVEILLQDGKTQTAKFVKK
ncbi:MAG: starch-binding protein [Bacteroidales bacterium]|jgi:hypothetical protein|nr:starch-binding protein [Bacteroidales bacterium]